MVSNNNQVVVPNNQFIQNNQGRNEEGKVESDDEVKVDDDEEVKVDDEVKVNEEDVKVK